MSACLTAGFLGTVNLVVFGYTVESGVTLQVNDSNVASYAEGIAFADATGNVEFDTSSAPTMAITGQGTCIKTSSAAWTMSTDRTAFDGRWILRNGITTADSSSKSVFNKGAAGDANSITVESGATLYIAAAPKLNGTGQLGSSDLHLAGTGYSGEGALKTAFASANYSTTCYFFTKIILDADASINPTASCGYNVKIETQGHDLTFSGTGSWYLTKARVTGGGNIHYPVSSTTIVDSTQLGESTLHGSVSFANGVNFSVFGGSANSVASQIYADINPVGNSGFVHTHRYNEAQAFTPKHDCCATSYGDITIPDGKTFTSYCGSYACRNVFDGQLKGSGTFAGYSGAQRGRVELNSPNNPEFTGSIHFYGKNEAMALGGYRMISDWANLTGDNGGALALDMDDEGNRWTNAQVADMANKASLHDDTLLGLDPKYCTGHRVSFDGSTFFNALTTPTIIGLGAASATWDSEATISFNSPVSRAIELGSFGGTAVVTGAVPITVQRLLVGVPRAARGQKTTRVGDQDAVARVVLSGVDVSLPEGARARVGGIYAPVGGGVPAENAWEVGRFGELVVTNATLTDFNRTTFPKNTSDALWLGYNGDGILNIQAGGVVTTRLAGADEQTGYGGGYQNDARAVVYVDGGTFNLRGELNDTSDSMWNRSHLNYASYGYLGVFNGGALNATGNWAVQYGGNSVMEFDHATWTHDADSTAARFEFNYNGGISTRTQCYLKDSQADFGTMSPYCSQGGVELTLDGASASFRCKYLNIQGARGSAQNVTVNLSNGATLDFDRFSYLQDGPTAPHYCQVNFNGGRMIANQSGYQVFTTGVDALHEREAVVYAGGAEICVSNSTTLGATMIAPEGKGVSAIDLASAGGGYIGSPRIAIEGDGWGATAVARFDPATRTLKAITVTSPGYGYTWAKAHFIENSAYTNAVVDCSLADNALTGGFTKTGPGTLTLGNTNAYRGVTRILEGGLKLSVTNALPVGGDVFVADGATLDFNQKPSRIGALGGTGGTVKNFPSGSALEADCPLLASDSGLDLQVPVRFNGTWDVDLAGLAAGLSARYDAQNGVEFGNGAKISFSNASLFMDPSFQDNAPYTLFSVEGLQTITGSPELLEPLPEGWVLKVSAKSIRLSRIRGMVFFVK